MALSIIYGNQSLELRPSSIDKAIAVKAVLKDLMNVKKVVDFILCVGDGKTDEPVFALLNTIAITAGGRDENDECGLGVFTCTVGKKQSEAEYFLTDVEEVVSVLGELV